MESKLFELFDPDLKENREFTKHISELTDLPPEALSICLQQLSTFLLIKTESEYRRFVADFEELPGFSKAKALEIMNLMSFFVRRKIDEEFVADTPESWANDLVTLSVLSEVQAKVFINVVSGALESAMPLVNVELKANRSSVGVLPFFVSISSTVELRGIQDNRFAPGTEISDYEPKFSGVVPIASIQVEVDAGPNRDFFFQLDEVRLKLLIDSLRATLADLSELKKIVA